MCVSDENVIMKGGGLGSIASYTKIGLLGWNWKECMRKYLQSRKRKTKQVEEGKTNVIVCRGLQLEEKEHVKLELN